MVQGWTSSIVNNIITTFQQLRQPSYPPSLPKLRVSCQCPAAPLNCLQPLSAKTCPQDLEVVKGSAKFGQVWPWISWGWITRGNEPPYTVTERHTASVVRGCSWTRPCAKRLIGFKAICIPLVGEVIVFPILQSPPDERLIFWTCQLHTAWKFLH